MIRLVLVPHDDASPCDACGRPTHHAQLDSARGAFRLSVGTDEPELRPVADRAADAGIALAPETRASLEAAEEAKPEPVAQGLTATLCALCTSELASRLPLGFRTPTPRRS